MGEGGSARKGARASKGGGGVKTLEFEPNVLFECPITNKLDLKRCEECISVPNLSIYYTRKNIKSL